MLLVVLVLGEAVQSLQLPFNLSIMWYGCSNTNQTKKNTLTNVTQITSPEKTFLPSGKTT